MPAETGKIYNIFVIALVLCAATKLLPVKVINLEDPLIFDPHYLSFFDNELMHDIHVMANFEKFLNLKYERKVNDHVCVCHLDEMSIYLKDSECGNNGDYVQIIFEDHQSADDYYIKDISNDGDIDSIESIEKHFFHTSARCYSCIIRENSEIIFRNHCRFEFACDTDKTSRIYKISTKTPLSSSFFMLSTLLYLIAIHVRNRKFLLLFLSLYFGSIRAASSTHIVTGFTHNCILRNNGIKCWGVNSDGRLGYEDSTDRGSTSGSMGANLLFVQLGPSFKPMQVVTGYDHSCALSTSNKLKCWGGNYHGQLGYGDQIERGSTINTMGEHLLEINLGSDFVPVRVAAGAMQTCAISKRHTLKCWGWNLHGQLGYGDTNDRGWKSGQMGHNLSEIDLGVNFNVTDVAIACANHRHDYWNNEERTDEGHTCALSTNKTIKCWGANDEGQLGYEDTATRGNQPSEMGENLAVVNLGAAFSPMAINVGLDFSCALSTTNKVKCWGQNNRGQLADRTQANKGDQLGEMSDNLEEIYFGDMVDNFILTQITAGANHACALSANHTVICWGRGSAGRLGYEDEVDRNTASYLGFPEEIDLGQEFIPVQITAGNAHTCALSINDTVKCWGRGLGGGISNTLDVIQIQSVFHLYISHNLLYISHNLLYFIHIKY